MTDQQIHEQFISILEDHIGILLKISKAYTGTSQDREDLINDMTFELWKAYPGFKGRSKVSTWMYRVALNTALNYKRNSRKKPDFLMEAIEISRDAPSPESDTDPQVELLYDCIAELDEFNKAIILLYLDGYRHEEIAGITGITKTNVGTRISRIKEQLRILVQTKQEHDGNG
ncbi:MAG: RNA polymerase sigma factor [Bacteroidales bacterium]